MNSSVKNNEPLCGKRVLVTGAAGFIASQLVRKLLDCGARVSVLVRPGADLWRLRDVLKQLEIHHGDLGHLTFQKIQSEFSSPQIIYHLGASGVDSAKSDDEEIFKANILGTWTLLKLARHLKAERFIYCGSCFEYGSGNFLCEDLCPAPISGYGVSKVSAGMLAKMLSPNYGLPVVSLRPFTVYGPFEARHRWIPHVIMSSLKGRDIELTTAEQTRDFVFVEDVLEAFLKAGVVPGIVGETFNVATGEATSVADMVLKILKLMNVKIKPLFGVRPSREFELWSLSGDPSKARDKLQWTAKTSLEEGLKKTIRWFEENGRKYPAYRNSPQSPL